MLGQWQTHRSYLEVLTKGVSAELQHNPLLLTDNTNNEALQKMQLLNLDCVYDDLSPFYSKTGKPSNHQPEIFRSFVIMNHFKHPQGLDDWVTHVNASPFLCSLVGVQPRCMPGASTHRDFVTRLWQADEPCHERVVVKKPKKGHGKDKMPPERPGIVYEMAGKAMSGEIFDNIPEWLIQTIFYKTAVLPSANMGLLGNVDGLTARADGACVLSHATPYGHKTCECEDKCDCPRWFPDPDAAWGWDCATRS